MTFMMIFSHRVNFSFSKEKIAVGKLKLNLKTHLAF